MRHRDGLLLSVLAFLVLPPNMASGVVLLVNPGESIQAAMDAASPGDDVIVLPGTYYETLILVDGVNLKAQAPGTAIVDAEAVGSVVQAIKIGSNTLVEGLVFRNGSAEKGGGLFAIHSSAMVVNCRFESNGAAIGGGVSLTQGSTMHFDSCTFTRNTALVGGGIHLDFSAATINNCYLTYNEAGTDGAAMVIQNASQATFEDVCIYANRAMQGAVISIIYSSPTLWNCTVSANIDEAGLGTITTRGSQARIERCIVAFNTGPALQCTESDNSLVGCNDIFGNTDDTICGDDQGDNISVDPLFCNPQQSAFNVQANSPVLGTACGDMGAHITTCPALTAVETTSWSQVKRVYGR